MSPPPSLPSTPVRKAPAASLPPFSPRIALFSPQALDTISVRDVTLATGCELIVRGIGASETNSNAVALLETAIKTIQSMDPTLASIHIRVKPFNTRNEWSTTCYVHLDPCLNASTPLDNNAEPRCDLLVLWLTALSKYNSDWEIHWTPAKHGTDKRSWIRFPELRDDSTNPSFQSESRDKLLRWAKTKALPVSSSFLGKGGVTLSMASPHHVDTVVNAGTVLVPGFPNPLRVARGRQIEICNAFEIVIMGVPDDYEDMDQLLKEWITQNFLVDGESTLAGYRASPDEPEAFIFHMTTWKATKAVLSQSTRKLFEADFAKYPTLIYPRTVHEVNTTGVWKIVGNIRGDFAKGADSMNDTIKALTRRIDSMEDRNQKQHEATHLQLAAVTSTLQSVTQAVTALDNRLVSSQRAILAQSAELGLTRGLSNVRANKTAIRMKLLMGMEPEKVAEAQAMMAEFEEEEASLQSKIDQASRNFLTIVGGHVSQLQPAPLSNPAPPSVPTAPPGISKDAHTDSLGRQSSASSRSKPSDDRRSFSTKRRRLSNDDTEEKEVASLATGVSMAVDVSDPQAKEVDMVCHSPPPLKDTLMVTHDDASASSLNHTKKPLPRSSGIFRGVFDCWRDLSKCHRDSRPLCRFTRTYKCSPDFNILLLLGMFVLAVSMSCTVSAYVPPSATSSFTIYGLNANGMVQPVKVSHFNTVIGARRPHIFVVNETKTKSKLGGSLPFSDYDIYEEPGECAEGHHIFKWGVIVGVRKDIQVAQRLEITQRALKGRVIALDIILTTPDGRCFRHRFIGAYAPWNPGGSGDVSLFWRDMTSLCQSTTSSWTMAGDFNATIASFERLSGGADARAQYLKFLADTNGHDLWSDFEERSRFNDWTCKSSRGASEGNIIDRVVTSRDTRIDSEISVADRHSDWIPYTDHRAIIARVVHAMPGPPQSNSRVSTDLSMGRAANRPRIKIPLKSEKHKYQIFRDLVDESVKAESLHEHPVIDDDSFIKRYTDLTGIITSIAANTFGHTKQYQRRAEVITNSKIKVIVSDIRRVGGAIRFENSDRLACVSLKAKDLHASALRDFSRERPDVTFVQYLKLLRRQLHKLLFAEKSKEVLLRARLGERLRIAAALKGGSTRKLIQSSSFISFPLALNDLDDPEKLVCDPEGVKSTTREYFSRLYDHSRVPELPKPWLDTPSVKEVRSRVTDDPFIWPIKASLADFRAMLRRGNNKPSPGPDGWEKWTIKSLSDDTLSLVLDLHNYQVLNSRFPGNIKDMWLTMFHKRGLRTDLQNWRGLLLSNFLANSPMAWLNSSLMRYSAEKRILPDTQVAAQPGVQTRDLMSYLSGVRCWANRHKQQVFALKRDQKKGFDHLSPEGFYDAVRAYGLPESIIDLDRAAQHQTKCYIRTAYGATDPIIVSGLNKQGGAASPLKSTFTTSLGHYFLNDLLSEDPDALVLTTGSMLRDDPHLTDAKHSLLVAMVEATDDSYIFTKTLESLRRNALAMERFQYAYGWLTQWAKSRAYVLAASENYPDVVKFQSVSTGRGVNPLDITEHDVALVKDDLDFLRTKVNDPASRFAELKDFIEGFQFPTVVGRLPITLIRKIVSQNIVSRCRALLSLQPVKQSDADALDRLVVHKVHDALGFPFQPSTPIATLPVSYHGFDFPSIARINAAITVNGISRDLNHHIPSYRTMARITLMDWTCERNNCLYPLDGDGLQRDFSRQTRLIPAEWVTAQKVMRDLSLSLRATDQSNITEGDVSLSHVKNVCNHLDSQAFTDITGVSLRSLRLKGIRTLKDFGEWTMDLDGRIGITNHPRVIDKTWSTAAKSIWKRLVPALCEKIQIDDLVIGPIDLALPRKLRERWAEALISNLADVCEFPPSRYSDDLTWASDGSMIPAAAGILDSKSVTGAATGRKSMVLKVPGRNVSILHGEQIGLIISLILAGNDVADDLVTVLTDHLNSVRLIDDSRTSVSQVPRLRYMNGRSYYRWILSLVSRRRVAINYTAGHSGGSSLEAKMNDEADFLATSSQKFVSELSQSPIPSFFMNDYTLHSELDGWIESNTMHFIEILLARKSASTLGIGHDLRMSTWAHDPGPPPDFPYTKAVSAHSAAVQLYARSGQLATEDVLYRRGKRKDDLCSFGCEVTGNMHHIFVNCMQYSRWRDDANRELVERTELKLTNMKIEGAVRDGLLATAKSLFSDSTAVWPLHHSLFYLGQIPNLDLLISREAGIGEMEYRRLRAHISSDWHTASIRLAGRIFGDYQRKMAVLNNCTRRR
jgi:hypothetical protein